MDAMEPAVKAIQGLAMRYWLLQAHYRKPVNMTEDGMQAALKRVMKIYTFIPDHRQYITGSVDQSLYEQVIAPMFDDLNTPKVLANLAELEKDIKRSPTAPKMGAYVETLKLLGLGITLDLPETYRGKIKFREGGL